MKIKFKRDTSFRKQFFVPDSLMRIKFMSSVLFMLFKEPIMFASITFLTSCYKVIEYSLTTLCNWYDVVGLQDNTIFNSPPAILAREVIPAQNRKPNSQSSLFQMVIAFLAFARAEGLPMARSYKRFTTLKATIWSLIYCMSLPILASSKSIQTVLRAIAGTATGSEFVTTNYTFNRSVSMPFTIHCEYIIAQYTGGYK